ncbi:MAG: Rieske (2Fe-2S) protein [Acidimicrobiia bacterium]|nr:Rieske (2Fe-2S) protein [Acidimicrobiia bacterium]
MIDATRDRVSAGRLADLPVGRCRGIGDGRAVVARVGDTVTAFQARCLHQTSHLGGGLVKDGVITCPLHFWRYDATTGAKLGEPERRLRSFPVEIVDGEVFVELPPVPPPQSMREILLGHARRETEPGAGR